jgi:hypothetical protein
VFDLGGYVQQQHELVSIRHAGDLPAETYRRWARAFGAGGSHPRQQGGGRRGCRRRRDLELELDAAHIPS